MIKKVRDFDPDPMNCLLWLIKAEYASYMKKK